MSTRKPIGKKLRFEVFKRDSFTCTYCGGQPPKVLLHVDHIMPVKAGGGNDIDNLTTACDACNFGKGANELTNVPLTVKEKTEILREKEEQIVAFNTLIHSKMERLEETAWIVAEVFMDFWGDTSIRKDKFASIKKFCEQLDLGTLCEAANMALSRLGHRKRQAFSYFCGICWRLIKEGRTL